MAGGFFKNTGADLRQLIENSFLEGYRDKFIFLSEAFKYTYVRSDGYLTTQTYTYKSLLKKLKKSNINITDINIAPADIVPMFGILRLTCLFKDKEKNPEVIKVISQSLESRLDDYYSDEA